MHVGNIVDRRSERDGVKVDFEMYSPLVKSGGIIVLHDICNKNEGVEKFWNEITLPKVSFKWGKAAAGVTPGLGLVQMPE